MNLHRYWFTLKKASYPTPLNIGCGITAYSRDDAIGILRQKVFSKAPPQTIEDIFENIDISILDKKHVIPNMGSVARRGVWFPQGYED